VKSLIITADDYGMSEAVNEAIHTGIECGLITSTNVMTNMAYYENAKNLRARYENVSVGLHWNLSCGKPVLPPSEIPSLTDGDSFYSYAQFRSKYRMHEISDVDIKKELIAQYQRFVTALGKPDYWNTHQNVHVDFFIYRLFVDVAVELGIKQMRSHQRIYVPCSVNADKQPLARRLLEPFKSKLLDSWQNRAHKKGIDSPDGLIVCFNNLDANRLDYLFSHIDWKNKSIGEYVIHPAVRNDSPHFGRIVEQRIVEYHNYTSEKTRKSIRNAGIELVSYQRLQCRE
jgi:chitin disaccharide deacetylase